MAHCSFRETSTAAACDQTPTPIFVRQLENSAPGRPVAVKAYNCERWSIMIVSNKKGFIMLLPWKTASSTAYSRLEPFNESPYQRFYDYNVYLQRIVHQHLCYSDFMLLPESKLGYRVGAFVRNPYDRFYSGFLQVQRDILTQPTQPFAKTWVKEMGMRQLSDNFSQMAAADFDFNKWAASITEYQVYEIGRNTSLPLHPCHYWAGIEQQKIIDFVGRVENFEADFDSFCGSVGVKIADRVSENVTTTVQEFGRMERPRYLDHMSASTISKINTLFSADFDMFGYRRFDFSE